MKRTESLAVVASTIALLVVTMLPMSSRAETLGGSGAERTAESSETWPKLGLGVRLGGHGFRHVRHERVSWEDCRMNGAGLFATLDFTNHFFGELSVSSYHATGSTVAAGMDRVSVYVLGAAGARLLPEFIVSPYLQVGIGPEWTRIEVGDHLEATVLAAPFIGVGGELNLGSLKLGGHVRSYLMGLPGHLDGTEGHVAGGGLRVHYETAGQAQFFARWEF